MEGECEHYELIGIVSAIANDNGQWTHSVAMIKDDFDPWVWNSLSFSYGFAILSTYRTLLWQFLCYLGIALRKLPWCLFNDVLVTRLHTDEALHMDSRWKLPLILCYANKKSGLMQGTGVFPVLISALFRSYCYRSPFLIWQFLKADCRFPPLFFILMRTLLEITRLHATEELWISLVKGITLASTPSSSILMAMYNSTMSQELWEELLRFLIFQEQKGDKEQGQKSVGRVSCVDSTGEHVLIDDYVVTCEGDVVKDYLTQFRYYAESFLIDLLSFRIFHMRF